MTKPPAVNRYRLYVDESGDHTYNDLSDPSRRYLALTGVAIETEYYRQTFQPEFEALKQRHFPHSPDHPVVLVRRQIIDRKGRFGLLTDPARRVVWDKDLLDFLSAARFELFSAVIDKQDHLNSYGVNARHPYHYCLTVLLERLRGWLNARGGVADVLAEARGGVEDRLLQAEYDSIWQNGTDFQTSLQMQLVLTSRHLKMQWKDRNVAGLQLADLVAAPSKQYVLARFSRAALPSPGSYSEAVVRTISPKFNYYGRVLLSGFR
jgi:hypothetical protein